MLPSCADSTADPERSRRGLQWLGVAILVIGMVTFAGCGTLGRVLRYGSASINDARVFPTRRIPAPPTPQPWAIPSGGNLPDHVPLGDGAVLDLNEFVPKRRTVAFLVVHDGMVVDERSFREYPGNTGSQIFSVTKSIQSLLVGRAIADGLLPAPERPITGLVPELKERGYDDVTLRHLLQMTSGSDYRENDNPFGRHVALYYGRDMVRSLRRTRIVDEPGTVFRYKSGDSQVVGLALSRALAPRSISDYAREVLWQPLGMESDGLWALDDANGLERTFCCITMTARDLAKIGWLVAQGGQWQGQQLIPKPWIDASLSPEGAVDDGLYQLGWWRLPELEGGLMGSGHLGQYLFILPEYRLVMVRLGEKGGYDLRRDYARLAVALGKMLEGKP